MYNGFLEINWSFNRPVDISFFCFENRLMSLGAWYWAGRPGFVWLLENLFDETFSSCIGAFGLRYACRV